MVNTDLEIGGG
jgi:hypothetical protein